MIESALTIDPVVRAEFYNKLGYLYYGIFAAAGKVTPDELSTLKRAVTRLWMENEAYLPEFQGYTPNKVDAMFDWLNLNDAEWEYCVNEFIFFIKNHTDGLSKDTANFIVNGADEISRYVNANDNEALILLKNVMQKIA
jgi:hypothetical protein